MTELRINTKTVHHVDYDDLGTFLAKVFGFKDYHVTAEEECGNNVALEFTVDASEPEECDAEDLREMIATKRSKGFRTGVLMCEACRRGLIPPGDYVVQVFW